MAKYKLKEGVVIHPNGPNTIISNENINDSIAEHLLNTGKASLEDFEPIENTEEVETKTKTKK